jgi:hypothetical protein
MHGNAARLSLGVNAPHGMVATIEVPLAASARTEVVPAAALAS